MKFVCDRCGKRFASVDEPAPGRVYRIRCRCGHVILVRGPAGASSAAPAAEAKLRRFEPPPAPPVAPAQPEGEREEARGAAEPGGDPARDGAGSRAPEPAGGRDEARGEAPGPERAAARAPLEEGAPAPAPGHDETEPEVSHDPFQRPANEAAEVAAAPDVAANGGAALAMASGDVERIEARLERPPLSLGLDDAGGEASRRLLFASIVALLAAIAALVVWRI